MSRASDKYVLHHTVKFCNDILEVLINICEVVIKVSITNIDYDKKKLEYEFFPFKKNLYGVLYKIAKYGINLNNSHFSKITEHIIKMMSNVSYVKIQILPDNIFYSVTEMLREYVNNDVRDEYINKITTIIDNYDMTLNNFYITEFAKKKNCWNVTKKSLMIISVSAQMMII